MASSKDSTTGTSNPTTSKPIPISKPIHRRHSSVSYPSPSSDLSSSSPSESVGRQTGFDLYRSWSFTPGQTQPTTPPTPGTQGPVGSPMSYPNFIPVERAPSYDQTTAVPATRARSNSLVKYLRGFTGLPESVSRNTDKPMFPPQPTSSSPSASPNLSYFDIPEAGGEIGMGMGMKGNGEINKDELKRLAKKEAQRLRALEARRVMESGLHF